jgi:metal-dependent HD superfamily phosphatase/phosphodiesterase
VAELDKETQERIDEPVSEQAEEEARLTPAEAVAQMRIRVPTRANRKLGTLLDRVNEDSQLKAWWHVSNINAAKRLEINDHSWVHIQIVANIGLKLLRQLTKHRVEPALVRDYGMSRDDAEIVVVLGALLHCIGMAIHREGHEDWSMFLAEPKMRELLDGLYEEPELTVVSSEVLGAITSHRDYGKPLTIEAGIVRVADALDMAKGRSRIPFEHGRVSIHSLSAAAIDEVTIKDGERTPILIEITMNNSSGVYQVDTDAEKSLIPLYRLEL